MYPRTEYEMTKEDLARLLDAMKPVPVMMIGGYAPPSRQESANAAWAELGGRMGFDSMTVRPSEKGDRFFTAIPSETAEHRQRRLAEEGAAKRSKEAAAIRAEIARLSERLLEVEAAS